MHVQAGAGVGYDSVQATECAERLNTAQALFSVAEEAVRFATKAKRGSQRQESGRTTGNAFRRRAGLRNKAPGEPKAVRIQFLQAVSR
jgi:hypothetical protein